MPSEGNPTGDCELSVTSFQRHPAAFGAKLVEESRREGVVPDDGECIIDLTMMEDIVSAIAVVIVCGLGNPVDGEADTVFAGDVASRRPL